MLDCKIGIFDQIETSKKLTLKKIGSDFPVANCLLLCLKTIMNYKTQDSLLKWAKQLFF